jgi:broad specificity phosphatase PhoE
MNSIYLIRHGQTAWNREEIFRGTMDIQLNDFGRNQARAVGSELKKRNLNNPMFVSSPLGRARETAEIAAEAVSSPLVTLEPALSDLDFGQWQGKSKADIAQLYPNLYKQWLAEPEHVIFPEGESLSAVAERAEAILLSLADSYRTCDLIIVSHRVVNKVLLCRLLGAGLSSFWIIKQDTACLNVLQYNGSSFTVNVINDTCHLRHLPQENALDF